MNSPDQAKSRPGGRTARVREQVHGAVWDLLRREDPDELTITRVAEQSGVHQATIYRRWGSLHALIDEVVASELRRTSPIPDTGSLRDDLHAFARQLAESVASHGPILARAGLFVRRNDPDGEPPGAYLRERTADIQAMFDRATTRGESAPTFHEFFEIVLAPIFLSALVADPVSPGHARVLADRLLREVEARRID